MYNPNLHFHFTGIGGSGMSGIAEILINLGFKVSGSDISKSEVCRRLEGMGAEICYGHAAANLKEEASLLVYSSAVNQENPELIEANRRGIPVIRRAEVLAELMRLKHGIGVAGSHGKTTTTSMTGAILEGAGLDPTVIIGGIVRSVGTGGRFGQGDYLVAESDESDRSFLLLRPAIAVVTNIDREHMEAYESFEDLKESFSRFVHSVPFYGLAVLCYDDPYVRELAEGYKGRKVSYGFSEDADIQARNAVFHHLKSSFEVWVHDELQGRVSIPLPGRHLVSNSLAAIAIGLELGVEFQAVIQALGEFGGVKRRMEILHDNGGATLISDYGHHPTEIKATLSAIREGWGEGAGRVYTVFQPHRYSRTRDCFQEFQSCFSDTDYLVTTDIYAASESPLDGISGESLFSSIDHPEKKYVRSIQDFTLEDLPELKEDDVVIFLGAGSIGGVAEKLAALLSPRS